MLFDKDATHPRRECRDHVIVFNEASLYRHVKSLVPYYHESRTHLALDKDSPKPRAVLPPERGAVGAIPQVGGLHHRYERRAAKPANFFVPGAPVSVPLCDQATGHFSASRSRDCSGLASKRALHSGLFVHARTHCVAHGICDRDRLTVKAIDEELAKRGSTRSLKRDMVISISLEERRRIGSIER